MDKEENTFNESTDENNNPSYDRDVTSVVLRNVIYDTLVDQINARMQQEVLQSKREVQGALIADAQIEIQQLESRKQEVGQQLYYATERKKQSMKAFERIGDTLNIAKDEVEKILKKSQDIQNRQEASETRFNNLVANKDKCVEYKKKIGSLEAQIQNLLNSPEPEVNQQLVQENKDLKAKLRIKTEELQTKRARSTQINMLKKGKFELQQKVFEQQQKNYSKSQKVDENKRLLENKRETLKNKLSEAQNILEQKLNARDDHVKKLKELRQCNEDRQTERLAKEEKVKASDLELQEIKKKIQEQQVIMEAENSKRKVELEAEVERLRVIEQQLQAGIEEKDKSVKEFIEKSEQIRKINDQKGELVQQLLSKKVQLMSEQYKQSERQRKIELITEKHDGLKVEVGVLVERNQTLDRGIEDAKMKLEKLPLECEIRREEIDKKSNMKIEELQKKLTFQNAVAELQQVKLDEKLKKIEDLKREVEECENEIALQKVINQSLKTRLDSLERGQVKSAVKKTYIEVSAARNKENINQDFDMQNVPISGISDTMEAESEETRPLGGSKSPGILKTQFTTPQTPTPKRVTFHGVPSSESSSSSVAHHPGVGFNTSTSDFDNLLKEWERDVSTRREPKPKIDF